MTSSLSKILNLIKKTGDKAIILDENGEPSFVVMAISDYEQLILNKSEVEGLTEDELLAKINRDIYIWKDSHDIEVEDLPIDQYDFSQKIRENEEVQSDFWDFDEPGSEVPDSVANKKILDFPRDFNQNGEKIEEDRYYFDVPF